MNKFILALYLVFNLTGCKGQKIEPLNIEFARNVDRFNIDKSSVNVVHLFNGELKEVDITNALGNVLRFRLDSSGNLLSYHSGLMFIKIVLQILIT